MMPIRFERPESIHLVGIGGAGMRALAELLLDRGVHVSGSDNSVDRGELGPLKRRGAAIFHQHDAANLHEDVDAVVSSAAVPADNVELLEATQRGLPRLTYPQALGRLMQGTYGISVVGTHGKSTTTAMVASILEAADARPSVICGAPLLRCPSQQRPESLPLSTHRGPCSGWSGDGSWLVAESCEYRSHFLELAPQSAILTGIEHDHPDCYATVDEACAAFRGFVSRLPADGRLVYWAGSESARQVARSARCQVVPVFGTELNRYADLQLPLVGEHNRVNAALAATLCRELGITSESIVRGLNQFPGLKRRFELHECPRGVTLVDDYAHHPTAIANTLTAVRSRFPGRRIVCAFEPHQASRTVALMEGFAQSLSAADRVFIAPIFAAREVADESHDRLAQQLASRVDAHRRAASVEFCLSLDHLLATLETAVRPRDVVVVMGAGDIDRIAHEFTGRVWRDRAS